VHQIVKKRKTFSLFLRIRVMNRPLVEELFFAQRNGAPDLASELERGENGISS
jgi:hypothetical protein